MVQFGLLLLQYMTSKKSIKHYTGYVYKIVSAKT